MFTKSFISFSDDVARFPAHCPESDISDICRWVTHKPILSGTRASLGFGCRKIEPIDILGIESRVTDNAAISSGALGNCKEVGTSLEISNGGFLNLDSEFGRKSNEWKRGIKMTLGTIFGRDGSIVRHCQMYSIGVISTRQVYDRRETLVIK